jgi:alpha-beta hydrolase superfamily lysophospholipase
VSGAESHFSGAGGVRIVWQSWLPDAEPRAVVVMAHGAGEHSGRYEHVAGRLVAEGYAVYAIDHRGHGRSGGPRALIDRMSNAVADLHTLVTLAVSRHPGAAVFLLGHSMGGMVSLRYAIDHEERLSGLVLSGPLAALDPAPAPQRIIAGIVSTVAPKAGLLAIEPSLISRDPAVVSAYVEDPLVHHGKLPARTVTEFAAAIESFPEDVRAITIPTLVMYGTEDRLCPPRGSVMLGERIGAADKTVTAYDGLHHEILNEPEQERVLDDMCTWLAAHVAVHAA